LAEQSDGTHARHRRLHIERSRAFRAVLAELGVYAIALFSLAAEKRGCAGSDFADARLQQADAGFRRLSGKRLSRV
jgi:hypothetical protein